MAKTTLSISWSVASAEYLARLPIRQLWQVPAFLVGALALAAAVGWHALASDPEARKVQHELKRAFEKLEEPESEDQARALAEHVLEAPHRTRVQSARAYFLLGIVHLRQADRASDPLALDEYGLAKENLEQAEALGVPDDDEPRLQYQLGRICAKLGEPAQTVIEHLTHGLPDGADDPTEGYELLERSYLKCDPPDIDGALDANKHLLGVASLPERLVWPARLERGKLLLAKHDASAARKEWEQIKVPAPAQIIFEAKRLLARSYQDEKRWEAAARCWAALAKAPELQAGRSSILCNLGLCYLQLNRQEEAATAFEQALKNASGEEEQAAALGLAELRLQNDPDAALQLLDRAVRDVSDPKDWTNHLVDLENARQRFETAWHSCLESGRYEQALHIGLSYVKIGPVSRGHQMAAQACNEWAQTLSGEAQQKAFAQAALEYQAAADPALPEHDRVLALWNSVDCSLRARAPEAALPLLEKMAQSSEMPEKVGEGWYRLAELYLASPATAATAPAGTEAATSAAAAVAELRGKAQQAYQECLKYPGKFQYRARYYIAREKLANGDVDGAIVDLNRNLNLLAIEMDRDAHENTLFELANILFHRQDYRQALARLTQALELYGDGPHMISARYQVAECYRKLAEQARDYLHDAERLPATNEEYYRNQRQESYRDAHTCYHEVAELLAPKLKDGTATDEDRSLYRVVRFNEAECLFQAGSYPRALQAYQELALLYPAQVERLHALAGKRRCFFALREIDKARAMLADIKRALDELNESAFDPKISRWPRQKWADWLQTEHRNDAQPSYRVDNPQNLRPNGFLNNEMLKSGSDGK